MIQYPDSIMVVCPICGEKWTLFDVEKWHDERVYCIFCSTASYLRRAELVDAAGLIYDVYWPLIREGGTLN